MRSLVLLHVMQRMLHSSLHQRNPLLLHVHALISSMNQNTGPTYRADVTMHVQKFRSSEYHVNPSASKTVLLCICAG
jgi:hypothetical protein